MGGVPTACAVTTNPCSDGYVQISLTTPQSLAIISCAGSALPPGQTFAGSGLTTSPNGGSCQTLSGGTVLNIGCGITAGTPAASTTASATCDSVPFEIQAAVGACVNTPTFCVQNGVNGTEGLNGSSFTGSSATLTVQFFSTPASGGAVGGIQLGTNTFSFQGPGVSALLVSASPQLIPSNGTVASVVTATFACTTGANLVNGFPLSNNTLTTSTILGANTLVVPASSNICGASLPGTFNFTTSGRLLFDNGRPQETISCGLNGNVNPFGNGATSLFPSRSTAPLVFTCSGAAVLAVGAGAAGDAPVNVVYQSAVGGLLAIGSTLITVSPSGTPRLSLACSPGAVSAGCSGSLCTATVTDQNGVALGGSTGATVTFTTSDPSGTTVLPCVLGTPGAINVTTAPPVVPLLQPDTPCQTPSNTIPGQVNTFVNGQATALLVGSSSAHPETVTVTASLGVLVPPSFACLVAPYLPSGYGSTPSAAGYYAPVSGVGLPGVTGCGTASPLGTTGLATAFDAAGVGLTGIVTLPNVTSAATMVQIGASNVIQIAGASPISPLVLGRGCNTVVVTSAVGTPVAGIAALVSPASMVVSIWQFDNGTKLFRAGYFADRSAPVNFSATGSAGILPAGSGGRVTETYYICVSQGATLT